jgi:hypothetical protein
LEQESEQNSPKYKKKKPFNDFSHPMFWRVNPRKRVYAFRKKHNTLSQQLREEGKTNDEFEIMFNNLTLEEVIGLKLELAARSMGGKLYGFPIFSSMTDIVKTAVLYYLFSFAKSKEEVGHFLHISPRKAQIMAWVYGVSERLEKQKKNDEDFS